MTHDYKRMEPQLFAALNTLDGRVEATGMEVIAIKNG